MKIETLEQAQFESVSYKVDTIHGSMFVVIMEYQNQPIGIQVNIGKCGNDISAWAHAMGRVCSIALEHGATMYDLMFELTNNSTDKDTIRTRSGVNGIAFAISSYIRDRHNGGREDIIRWKPSRLVVRGSTEKPEPKDYGDMV